MFSTVLLFLSIQFLVLISAEVEFPKRVTFRKQSTRCLNFQESRSLEKRQSGPICGGAASGSVSASASSGTPVAQVSSRDATGLSIWYTISDPNFSSAFNVNPYTGAISVGSNFAAIAGGRSSVSFTVQTTNAAGGVSYPS